MEAVRHASTCEPVVLAPQDQCGHPERGDAAVVWDQLLEVARPIQLEVTQAARIVGESLAVLLERIVAHSARDGAHGCDEALASVGAHQALSISRRAHHICK